MKKVIFGSACFIGGVMLYISLVNSGANIGNLIDLFLYILVFVIMIGGFILGLIGLKRISSSIYVMRLAHLKFPSVEWCPKGGVVALRSCLYFVCV